MDVKRELDCPIGLKNATEIDAMKSYYDMKFTEVDGKISAIFDKIDSVLEELHRLRDKYAERLPVWASVLMSLMTAVIGVLGTAVVELLKKGGL